MMTAPTNFLLKAIDEMVASTLTDDSAAQNKHERIAATYVKIAEVQERTTANILAYLSADRRGWNAHDEAIIRERLRLPDLPHTEPTVLKEVAHDPDTE